MWIKLLHVDYIYKTVISCMVGGFTHIVVFIMFNSRSVIYCCFNKLTVTKLSLYTPLPSDRHHLSCDDCLEDKREDYQKCSVLYCVAQLYTVISTYI